MKNLNKNISVWQGDNTPASTTSLWLKEDGLYVYNNQWVKTSPIDFETEVDDKISKVKEEINEKVGEAASEINTKLDGKLDKIPTYVVSVLNDNTIRVKYTDGKELHSMPLLYVTTSKDGIYRCTDYVIDKNLRNICAKPVDINNYVSNIWDLVPSELNERGPLVLGYNNITSPEIQYNDTCAWGLKYNFDGVTTLFYTNQSGFPEIHRKSQWVDETVHWATKISYDSSTRSIKLISDQEEMSSDSIPEATINLAGLINLSKFKFESATDSVSRWFYLKYNELSIKTIINIPYATKTDAGLIRSSDLVLKASMSNLYTIALSIYNNYLALGTIPASLIFNSDYFKLSSSNNNIYIDITSRVPKYDDIIYLQRQISGNNTTISELQTNELWFSNLINTNTTNITELDSKVTEITKALGDYDKKIFADKYWHTNGFIRKSNGILAELPTLPQWNYTDFIEVSENELVSISIKSNTDDVSVIACYDKDKNYLSSKSIGTSSGAESWNKQYNYTLIVDSEIKYIRCSCNTGLNSSKDITITKSTDTISDRIISLENTVSEVSNNTVSLTYLTPEDYGAKGDLATDDTTALNKCIADAITKGKAVKALNKYLVSDTITITGNNLDIEINEIKGTSASNPTIKYDGGDSVIKINTLTSNYIGLELNTTTNKCIENTFNINKIDALHCIVYHIVNKAAFGNIFHFNCLSGKHKSWSTGYPVANENSYGITDLLYGDIPSNLYVSENSYYGGMIYNFSWAFYGTGNNNKFYNWGFENPFGGGWNFVNEFYCQIYADRHTEVVKDNDDAKLIKLTSTTKDDKDRYYVTHGSANSEGLYYKSTQVIYPDNIDLSEAPIYSKVEGNKVLYLTNSSQSTIDCRMQANLVSSGTYSHLTNKFYIVGNLLILSPDLKVWKEVTTDTLDLRTLSKESKKFPTTFEVKANTNIYLHSSYCFLGYSDFDIIQRDSFKAKVYDYNGNLIWDGTSKDAGTYHFAHRAYGETNYNVFINGYGAKWFVNDELQALSWYPTTGEIS